MKMIHPALLSLFCLFTFPQVTLSQTDEEIDAFIPEGYVLFEKVYGDLNKDEQEDCILIVKGTDKEKFTETRFGEIVDRNRRGIIVLFHKNDGYELAVKNLDCFSSENEDGGVYFAPDLSVYIEKGNLYFNYGHGRYGYWRYTFKFQSKDFELIGYDQSDDFGPIVNKEISINFLTKRKLERINTNKDTQVSGDEVFEESWTDIEMDQRIKLSEIEDFDKLEI
ncbi:hypothetical protein [Sphingobacterium shayense]|uniref:hypothetical protein n=1 Tax=Sphingobacterium shayense TaxID=626343 RepID=UPI001C12FCD7|nr:hypothetical protein [Sphingobacterium shayense]